MKRTQLKRSAYRVLGNLERRDEEMERHDAAVQTVRQFSLKLVFSFVGVQFSLKLVFSFVGSLMIQSQSTSLGGGGGCTVALGRNFTHKCISTTLIQMYFYYTNTNVFLLHQYKCISTTPIQMYFYYTNTNVFLLHQYKCISTTPIPAPIYIWPLPAIPPAPPLILNMQKYFII